MAKSDLEERSVYFTVSSRRWWDTRRPAFWDDEYFVIYWKAVTGESPQAIVPTQCFTHHFVACHVLFTKTGLLKQTIFTLKTSSLSKTLSASQTLNSPALPHFLRKQTSLCLTHCWNVQNSVLIILHPVCKHSPCFVCVPEWCASTVRGEDKNGCCFPSMGRNQQQMPCYCSLWCSSWGNHAQNWQ